MLIFRRIFPISPARTPVFNYLVKSQFCSDDDFKKQSKVQVTNENAQELIKKWVHDFDIVLFMKGTPQTPKCGYSGFVVGILKKYGIFEYKAINILEDPIIRQQVKVYSKWPTYPQLFIKGELVGGADIVNEMHKDNSLKQLLEKNKLI